MAGKLILDMPMQAYQALPAMSASGIDTLANDCPAHYWHSSPWNPNPVARKNKKIWDFGTAAHLSVLEPHKLDDHIVAVPFDSYRTKEAKALRDGAYSEGKLPLKAEELGELAMIREAVFSQVGQYFTGGHAEASISWILKGIPAKCRPDYLNSSAAIIADLKTTGSADPATVARKAFAEGWEVRVPWYLDGASSAFPGPRWRYIFVVVEAKEPHLIQCYELGDRAIEWGRQAIGRGISLFKKCMATKSWPDYGGGVLPLDLPVWAEHRYADREAEGEFAVMADVAREWLAP